MRSSLILWSTGLAWRAILLQFLVAVFAKDWMAFRGTLTAWKAAVANVLSLFIGFVAFEILVAGDDRFFVGDAIGIALLLSCSVFTAPFMIAPIPEAWFDRLLPRSARAVPR